MSDIAIEVVCDGELAEILRNFERFWGSRDLARCSHPPMYFLEFGHTAFAARDRGSGEVAAYVLGFVAPTGDGYINFVAVRDDFRGSAWAGRCVKFPGRRRANAARWR